MFLMRKKFEDILEEVLHAAIDKANELGEKNELSNPFNYSGYIWLFSNNFHTEILHATM